jgi:hypothetical protein
MKSLSQLQFKHPFQLLSHHKLQLRLKLRLQINLQCSQLLKFRHRLRYLSNLLLNLNKKVQIPRPCWNPHRLLMQMTKLPHLFRFRWLKTPGPRMELLWPMFLRRLKQIRRRSRLSSKLLGRSKLMRKKISKLIRWSRRNKPRISRTLISVRLSKILRMVLSTIWCWEVNSRLLKRDVAQISHAP